MKYSVIIPVYKTESTLSRCLDSILCQMPSNAEILLVNDGSPDGSGEICERYAAEYSCIRYFYKENGGVSSARNVGLDNAAGDYVLFVDSDDYVSKNYFAEIDKAVENKNADLTLFGCRNFGGNSNLWNTGSYFVDGATAVAENACAALRKCIFGTLWSKVFKREIIEKFKLRLNERLAISEDQTFVIAYVLHAESMLSVENVLYNLSVENAESLSRKRRDYLCGQLIESSLEMIELLKASALPENIKRTYLNAIVWTYYRDAYSACKELLKYDLNGRERRKRIRSVCRSFRKEGISPKGLRCILIATPVMLGLPVTIDILIHMADRRRKNN